MSRDDGGHAGCRRSAVAEVKSLNQPRRRASVFRGDQGATCLPRAAAPTVPDQPPPGHVTNENRENPARCGDRIGRAARATAPPRTVTPSYANIIVGKLRSNVVNVVELWELRSKILGVGFFKSARALRLKTIVETTLCLCLNIARCLDICPPEHLSPRNLPRLKNWHRRHLSPIAVTIIWVRLWLGFGVLALGDG